jgi:hypothetical protein
MDYSKTITNCFVRSANVMLTGTTEKICSVCLFICLFVVDGQVKLIDFGLCCDMSAGEQVHMVGRLQRKREKDYFFCLLLVLFLQSLLDSS